MTSYDYIEHSQERCLINNQDFILSYGYFINSSLSNDKLENECIIIDFQIIEEHFIAVCFLINNSSKVNYYKVLTTSYFKDNIDYPDTLINNYYLFSKDVYSAIRIKNFKYNNIITLSKQIFKEFVDENNTVCNDLLDKFPYYHQILENEIQEKSYSIQVVPRQSSNKAKTKLKK